jgi:hypothetical protein
MWDSEEECMRTVARLCDCDDGHEIVGLGGSDGLWRMEDERI